MYSLFNCKLFKALLPSLYKIVVSCTIIIKKHHEQTNMTGLNMVEVSHVACLEYFNHQLESGSEKVPLHSDLSVSSYKLLIILQNFLGLFLFL